MVYNILNPFENPYGGSDLEAIDVYKILKDHVNVSLWAQKDNKDVAEYYISRYNIKRIDNKGNYPKTGTLIIVGNYYHPGLWYYKTNFERIIVHFTADVNYDISFLLNRLLYKPNRKKELRYTLFNFWKKPKLDFVFYNQYMMNKYDLKGFINPSYIDIQKFKPGNKSYKAKDEKFTVGRLSRDIWLKHNKRDPDLYLKLAEEDLRIKIMGGTHLSDVLDHKNIDLLKVGTYEPVPFLQSLDCFIYRTADEWKEPCGRVVLEAMACGIPVVVENRGGYAEYIEDGVNGFVFDDNEEAYKKTLQLKRDKELHRKISQNARKSIEQIYSEENRRKLVNFYLNNA